MVKTLVIGLSLVGIFLMAIGVTSILRQEDRPQAVRSVETRSAVAGAPGIEALRSQLEAESARLNQLRETLTNTERPVDQPPTGSMETHIRNLTDRLATLQTQLGQVQQSRSQLDAQLPQAQRTQQAAQNQSRVQTEFQMQEIQRQIADRQAQLLQLRNTAAQPQGAEQMRTLEAEIAQLEASRQQLTSEQRSDKATSENAQIAIEQAAQEERVAISSEQERLEQEIADVRADLNYWNARRSNQSATSAQGDRSRSLRDEILRQEGRVSRLQQTLKTLTH